MTENLIRYFAVFLFVLSVSGCSALLPRGKQITDSPWKTFDEAKATYDLIVPYKTTVADLKGMGYDPFFAPNITILTYMDIISQFAHIDKKDLAKGLQECLEANSGCQAYEVKPLQIKSKRYGNFWLDLFNFKRKTQESGWKFKALIFIVNDTVVYKLWGGSPKVEEFNEKQNPLGPLQDSGEFIINRAF